MRPAMRQAWIAAPRTLLAIGALVLSTAGLPHGAQAHVKWCTTTNVNDPTLALHTVLSETFLTVLACFTLMVFVGFCLDGWIARRWPERLSSGLSKRSSEQQLMRAAAGAYFIYASVLGTMILTPDLATRAGWVVVVQFLIAFFLIWRRTCVLSGLGIIFLYLYAVGQYGLFHLTDYVFLPCLAVYLGSLSLAYPALARLREPLIVGGLAFSLAWTAIEKFLYPQWTFAVIAMHPSVGMGLPSGIVTVIAGFVEFTLAFYLVTGRGLLRLGGAGFASIFIAAMPTFGRIDVFGHLVVLAILAVVVLTGCTRTQTRMHLVGRGLAADAGWITFVYLSALVLFFVSYYALQQT